MGRLYRNSVLKSSANIQKSPRAALYEGIIWGFYSVNGCVAVYYSIKVCKLQSSYICGEIKKQIKNNEAYNRTKIGNYFRNGLK